MKKNVQLNFSTKKIESIEKYIDSTIYINNFTHLIEICIHDYFLKNDKETYDTLYLESKDGIKSEN